MIPARLSLLFAACVVLTGCQTRHDFTKIQATDFRGNIVAEWTARGRVVPLERGGYRITAVERRSGPPHAIETRYPDGWKTTVQGAHLWRWTCPKPHWLAEYEGDLIKEGAY